MQIKTSVGGAALAVLIAAVTAVTFVQGQSLPKEPLNFDQRHQKTCNAAECHKPQPYQPGLIQHPPFLEGKCLACHVDHQYDTPELLKTRSSELCLSCHEPIRAEIQAAGRFHPEGPDQTCLTCHQPHSSRVRNLLRDEAKLALCSTCHEDFLNQAQTKPYRHQYFDPASQCGNCHYAHTGGTQKFLRSDVGETCLTCHDLPIRVEGRNLENVGQRLREAAMIHDAMKSRSCPACHTPHGSTQSSLLLPGYPDGPRARYEEGLYALCWQCHEPAIVDPQGGQTGFRNQDTNLHSLHVRELKRGRACHVCHEAHASDAPHLLRRFITFNQWEAPLQYTPTSDGGVCQTPCHKEKQYSRGRPSGL
ncbi:MAG: hypothetical protein Kow0059_21510 [Candidatus Sumerlaeia bacterium]